MLFRSKVDKINNLSILDEYFEKDEHFSLQNYCNNSFGIYQEKPLNIILEFDKTVAEDVLNYHFHPTQKMSLESHSKVSFALAEPLTTLPTVVITFCIPTFP